MERIGDTLKRLERHPGFQVRLQAMKKEILSDPDIKAFLDRHRDEITEEMMDKSLGKLYEYKIQSKGCAECGSLSECKNIIPGYEPQLILKPGGIDVRYIPCHQKVLEDERRKTETLVQCLHMPKDLLKGTFADFTLDTPGRMRAVKKAAQFTMDYGKGHFIRGLYLYGPFGTGKTFLLGAIANGLAERGIQSLIVYVPEFIRVMKQAIGDHSMEDKIDLLKTAPVLMFDDIGAESVSSWARDEVLAPILQYRMLEQLPCFFTSNFSLADLKHHLTYSQKGEDEELKAARIIERIQYLAEPVKMDGPNKRLHHL